MKKKSVSVDQGVKTHIIKADDFIPVIGQEAFLGLCTEVELKITTITTPNSSGTVEGL